MIAFSFNQIINDSLLLALFLISSLYQRYLFDSEHTKTFEGAQQVIDDRIKLEYEREQQVWYHFSSIKE